METLISLFHLWQLDPQFVKMIDFRCDAGEDPRCCRRLRDHKCDGGCSAARGMRGLVERMDPDVDRKGARYDGREKDRKFYRC
jgi:hypothetical protein